MIKYQSGRAVRDRPRPWRGKSERRQVIKNRRANRAQALREDRKSKGITAKFVADAIGISPQYLSDLESGRRLFRQNIEHAYRKAIGL